MYQINDGLDRLYRQDGDHLVTQDINLFHVPQDVENLHHVLIAILE